MIIKRKLRLCLLLTLALFASGVMIAGEAFAFAWFNEDWLYRKQITIDHTKVQDVADPSATYADFPLLVFATGLSNINANGTDIRFTASDGITELPREIESYSGGTLYAWVKVTLTKDSSDSSDDVIFMYYGNPAATEPAPGSTYGSQNVWDSNFIMVQHLNESPANDDTDAHVDSTSNANHGTPKDFGGVPGSTTDATGHINGADYFDGSGDRVDVTNNNGLNRGAGAWTASGWVYSDATYNASGIVVFDNDGIVMVNDAPTVLQDDNGVKTSNTDLSVGVAWNYVVATRTGSTYYIYIDGVNTTAAWSDTGWDLDGVYYIGKGYGPIRFIGRIDEVRVSSIVRSADWIQTSFNNQDDPSAFLSISEQVSIPTMTEWGMMIFMILAGLGAVYYLRRQRIKS